MARRAGNQAGPEFRQEQDWGTKARVDQPAQETWQGFEREDIKAESFRTKRMSVVTFVELVSRAGPILISVNLGGGTGHIRGACMQALRREA
jgi:hypothetical protein